MLGEQPPVGPRQRYAWINDYEDWTFAVIEGRTAEEVVRIYGGSPDDVIGQHTFAQLYEDVVRPGRDTLNFHVQVVEHGDHVVAIEDTLYTGAVPEIARRGSAGRRRFFSVHRSPGGMLTQAIDGVVTAHFEGLYPIAPDVEPHEIRPSWAIGPEPDAHESWETCMALMEQQTGLAIDPAWLAVPRPTYRLPDPHWMLRDVPNADQP